MLHLNCLKKSFHVPRLHLNVVKYLSAKAGHPKAKYTNLDGDAVNFDRFYNVSFNKSKSGLPNLKSRYVVLGIETSCDDTAVGIVQSDGKILANIICSQHDIHKEFNGIVPILAMNAHKEKIKYAIAKALIVAFELEIPLPVLTQCIEEYTDIENTSFSKELSLTSTKFGPLLKENEKVLKQAFRQIDGIAVTKGPGLELCLRIGCETGQMLAYILQKPFVTVHHLEAHCTVARLAGVAQSYKIPSNDLQLDKAVSTIEQSSVGFTSFPKIQYPFLTVLVSGGHTMLLLAKGLGSYTFIGGTMDDSLGEAFDKVSTMLDAKSYNIGDAVAGGVLIEKFSREYEMEMGLDVNDSELGTNNPPLYCKPKTYMTRIRKHLIADASASVYAPHKKHSYDVKTPLTGLHREKMPFENEDMLENRYNFSFSGVKNAFRRLILAEKMTVHRSKASGEDTGGDVDWSEVKLSKSTVTKLSCLFQEVAFDHLRDRLECYLSDYRHYREQYGAENESGTGSLTAKEFFDMDLNGIVVVGGVASNLKLRKMLGLIVEQYNFDMERRWRQNGKNNGARKFDVYFPPPLLCTDNGVMVAWNAIEKLEYTKSSDDYGVIKGENGDISLDDLARARWPIA